MLNVLIVAKKGEIRDGLQALLATKTDQALISVTDSLGSAVEYTSDHRPVIVVIDSESPDSALRSAVTKMKETCPDTRLLVLVGDETSRSTAATYGADSVLVRGIKANDLAAAIERLMTEFLWHELLRGV